MSIPLGTAQALKLWHDVNLAQVHGHEADLSVRQVTILLTIWKRHHTIRDLAKSSDSLNQYHTGSDSMESLISGPPAMIG
jgi:hypothetical protein